MSFILDALRKVDQEKRPSGEGVAPVSSIEKLEQERFRRRRQYVAMAAIAIVSAGATAAALRMLPRAEAPMVEEPPSTTSAPAIPRVEPEAKAERPPPAPEKETPRREIAPPDSTSIAASEAEAEPETLGTIRVVGEASPTRSITNPAPESPEPSGKDELPPHFPQLVLQGTSVLGGKPVAVVSDRRVFEGDSIEGATVIRIEERSVELEFQGRRFRLSL